MTWLALALARSGHVFESMYAVFPSFLVTQGVCCQQRQDTGTSTFGAYFWSVLKNSAGKDPRKLVSRWRYTCSWGPDCSYVGPHRGTTTTNELGCLSIKLFIHNRPRETV
ncbi:hypothetical protein BDP27DRAFT_1339651 [Rhodocollybia butyracea]|uniref:Uncharacterized protein n=1 Tax=Rhodocollybia butyracea TaxID=206335 RepID=A0A9P5TZ46_9AGAR|nr:hypothetical protein BDP27DRAFT_1339651 [Rhodocollybia butyracea]